MFQFFFWFFVPFRRKKTGGRGKRSSFVEIHIRIRESTHGPPNYSNDYNYLYKLLSRAIFFISRRKFTTQTRIQQEYEWIINQRYGDEYLYVQAHWFKILYNGTFAPVYNDLLFGRFETLGNWAPGDRRKLPNVNEFSVYRSSYYNFHYKSPIIVCNQAL